MEFISKLWETLQLAIIGGLGAGVAAPFQKERSRKATFIFIGTGCACAQFLTPLASAWFEISTDNWNGVGFLIGAFGGSLISAVIKGIEAADFWALIRSRFGGGAE